MQEVSPKLIRACLAGSREALEGLVCLYERPLFEVLRRMTPDPTLAEDLAQEAFLRAIRRLDSYRADLGPFSTWLFAIVRNVLRDHRARERTKREGLNLLRSERASGGGGSSPERRVLAREAWEIVEREVGRLPTDQRLALVLRVHLTLSYEEIGRVLGVRTGTAKSRVHRARKVLREASVTALARRASEGGGVAAGRRS